MNVLTLLVVVAIAGAIGGAFNGWQINFFRSDLNPSDPAVEQVTDDKKKAVVKEAIKTPRTEKWGSFAFNVAAGALAAAISWSAYGPYALVDVFGGARPEYGLTLTALATAVIVGLGGTRWLTNERDKALLKQAGDVTAEKPASDTKRALMEKADPKQASRIAVMDI